MEEACRLAETCDRGAAGNVGLEERLERGEVSFFSVCPFLFPEGDDRRFLLEQQLGGRVHKNIGYDPRSGKAGGFQRQDAMQAERLRSLLADFSRTTTEWLAGVL